MAVIGDRIVSTRWEVSDTTLIAGVLLVVGLFTITGLLLRKRVQSH
jgi:hypothetical protein